jgi:uncharacterized protein
VVVRTAHVLGKGGLLSPLFVPFRFGLGAWMGSGSAWFPWIHVDDIVSLYVYALEHESLLGVYNACALERVRQKDFMKMLASLYRKRLVCAIPIFILKIFYKDLADTFETSVAMTSTRSRDAGYVYKYDTLKEALTSVVTH